MEILDTIDPVEFARAVKREVVEYQGQWVIRLLFPDSAVKYVRNLAVPVEGQHPIMQKIDAFVDNGPVAGLAGHAFDHIVLGDNNLGDGHIRFCLSNETILGWLKDQVADYEEDSTGYDQLHWANLLRDAAAIIAFLHEIWSIPYRERMEAEESYFNDPA